jgi:hypothetical protein
MDIKTLYETTDKTLEQIAEITGASRKTVWNYISRNYSREYRKEHHKRLLSKSKIGKLNSQFGLLPYNFSGEAIEDGKGYYIIVKPKWFTGRKGSSHIFHHHQVVCENLKITEIPKGWCVHHCDGDKKNNSFDNLVLILMGDHMKLHQMLKGATTISKESTLKWVEAHGTPYKRDDIVSSAWEHVAAKAAGSTIPCEDK